MPTNYDYYLNNQEDQISSQKRLDESGKGIFGAIAVAGTITGLVLLRRKIALSRIFSGYAKSVGEKTAVGGLSKYIIRSEIDAKAKLLSKVPAVVRNWKEAALKRFPSVVEQYTLGMGEAAGKLPGVRLSKLPTLENLNIGKWNTFLRGPLVAPLAPRASLGGIERNVATGKFGGLMMGRDFYNLKTKKGTFDIVRNLDIGIPSIGGRMEGARLDLTTHSRKFKSTKEMVEDVFLPRAAIKKETRRTFLKDYIENLGVNDIPSVDADYDELVGFLKKAQKTHLKTKNILTADEFLTRNANKISKSYGETLDILTKQELAKPTTELMYKAYKAQYRLGAGDIYTRKGSGIFGVSPQFWEKNIRGIFDSGWTHPLSGKHIPWEPRQWLPRGRTLTGKWPGALGKAGDLYATPSGKKLYSSFLRMAEGTFYTIPEEILNIGFTTRRTAITDFVSKLAGAHPQSWTGYAIRRNVGGMSRVLGYGFGAYYGFKMVNYLARQATGGWGVTDVAGKMYTGGREFQQNILDSLDVTDAMKGVEKAFPGTVKSPVAHAARMTAPLWMAWMGKKTAGIKGAKWGLALGIATALITWGDITQSPEELHKIFTGEQEIPIKKARYWPFGRTPFFGGKTMYWRQHWYPLLRSKYKYQGGLWESETEELAQGTPLSPILAPILTGKMWDPYYWEKKHYHDRPYPMTGELFEPTMPWAWLANLTIGNVIKPQRAMHPEYWGVPQEEPTERGGVPGASERLGMDTLAPGGKLPLVSTESLGWQASMGVYSLTEQMGLRGFGIQQLAENITGRSDILPEGPVVETARRATGFERAYWDLNIGDPGGFTEFFRRILPHRRRQIEEWNPIENTMPDWMPGSEHYIDFQRGDPYTKVEMGEARLPGAGYESLHRLHSEIPGVYDAVDRFLILSDVAPYSDEYKHYKALATGMSRKEKYWGDEVQKHVTQRAATQQEYEFLDLEPPEDITGAVRGMSTAYRHMIAGLTNFPSPHEMVPFLPTLNKVFPYKTAISAYKDYRLYGSDFTAWGHPVKDFIAPWGNKVRGKVANLFGADYVPEGEAKRREYEEYFDRMKFVKNMKLADMAKEQGDRNLAGQYKSLARKTMSNLDVSGRWSDIYSAMPKRERSFFDAFTRAQEGERDEILDIVPPQMQKLYKAQWNIMDRKDGLRGSYNVEDSTARDTIDYYRDNYLPEESYIGWHPDVNLRDVQLKVVKNEGMDMHSFNLWQSQERQMRRRPYVPDIEDIHSSTSAENLSGLQNVLYDQLQIEGYQNSRIFVTRTPARINSLRLNLNVRKNRSRQYNNNMREFTRG